MQRSDSGKSSSGAGGLADRQAGAVHRWWQKQTKDAPLFPDRLWSRPENKRYAGKLLIAGGHAHSFAAVSTAYGASQKAGAGSVRVILPSSLEKMLGRSFPEAEFAPSTPSGSFARTSLAQLDDAVSWADGVLLAGDFGRNSETAVLLESFVDRYKGNLIVAGDGLDYFVSSPGHLLDRGQTTLVGDLAQLQKMLAGRALLKHSMDLIQLVEALAAFTAKSPAALVTHHAKQVIVVSGGQVSTTAAAEADLTQLSAYASVWQLQQPERPFEALTCAAYDYGAGSS